MLKQLAVVCVNVCCVLDLSAQVHGDINADYNTETV